MRSWSGLYACYGAAHAYMEAGADVAVSSKAPQTA